MTYLERQQEIAALRAAQAQERAAEQAALRALRARPAGRARDVLELEAEAASRRQLQANEVVRSLLLREIAALKPRPGAEAQIAALIAAIKAAPVDDRRFVEIDRLSRSITFNQKIKLFLP